MKPLHQNKRLILLFIPILLLLSCAFVFWQASAVFGARPGYLFGFLFYWLFWCIFIPVGLIGIKSIIQLFTYKNRMFNPGIILCLFIPLIFVYAYAFPAAIRASNFTIVFLSLVISLVNAPLEEILWRGVYLKIFKEEKYKGILYSSVGLAVWHYAPQVIFSNPHPGGAHSFVIFAFFLGLAYAFAAWKQQSLFWVTIAHVLFDFGGLGARIYFI